MSTEGHDLETTLFCWGRDHLRVVRSRTAKGNAVDAEVDPPIIHSTDLLL